MRFKPVLAFVFVPLAAWAAYFTSTGVGGGGWLQSGAFLPSDPDVIVVGADVSGVYRTDDFGLHWHPWNEGLLNPDDQATHYVDDLEGVDYNGWSGFYAATRGGIYRAEDTGDWECMTPTPQYSYKDKDFYHANAIPFSCLDWAGDSLLVAGAGSVRWRTTNEEDYYPGLDSTRFEPYGDYDEQWSVWTLDLADMYASWQPDSNSTFGAARDISVANIDGTAYIALATPEGIYLKNAGDWVSLEDPLYDLDLTCWSIHLTARGTLYAGMQRAPGGPYPSGVYRIFDIRNPSGWSWVGDETKLAPDSLRLDEIGFRAELIFASVVDGEESDPDLLYLISRNSGDALFRGYQGYVEQDSTCTWEHKIYWKADHTYWYVDGSGVEQTLDMGWHALTSPAVIFHPIVSSFHRDRVGVQMSSRMHVSPDRGDTWLQRYTTNIGGYWRSNGYNELCTADIAFMNDGRAVESNVDNGVFRSSNTLLEAWERLVPPVERSASAVSDTAWIYETGEVCVRCDWRGSGKDALFVISGNLSHSATPCKLFMVDELNQWHHITRGLDSDCYMFNDLVFSDDSTCFVPYTKYDGRVGSGAAIEEFGVLKGSHEGGDWSWIPLNDGLLAVTEPDSCNAIGAEILFHDSSGRIFLAARHTKLVLSGKTEWTILPGAIYVLPSPDSTTWRLEYGGEGTDWRDFRCLAQSSEGTVLYAGTRGRSAMGWGGVLKCENPDSAVTTWTPLANTDETGYPFDYAVPFWAEGWTYAYANRILTDVRSLAVDPWNPDVVYAGLVGTGFMEKKGLWVYNRWGGGFWEHLSEGEAFAGMNVKCLRFSPVEQGRLLVGTHGHELYHVRVDSLQSVVSVRDLEPAVAPGLKLLGIQSKLGGGRTIVSFSLSRPSRLEMQIFDAMGRLICRRDAGQVKAGESSLTWDGCSGNGRRCASGVYFARLIAGDEKAGGKFRLIR